MLLSTKFSTHGDAGVGANMAAAAQGDGGAGFKPGDPFNPYKQFAGVYIPEPVCKFRGLTPGAKLILGRLFRYAGKDGRAYPSMPTLGAETGMSADQARRYVRELEDGDFIRCEREPGKASHYIFLWHRAYQGETGAPRMGGRPLADAPVPKIDSTPGGCASTPLADALLADAPDEESHILKENQKRESSSSVGTPVQAETTDDDPPFFSEKENPKPEDRERLIADAQKQLQFARASMLSIGPGEIVREVADVAPSPDRAITIQILEAFSDYADFQTWIEDTIRRRVAQKARDSRWGLYLADARNHAEDFKFKREAADKARRDAEIEQDRQRQVEANRVRTLDVPMPALQAFGYIQARMAGRRFPWPLKARLERTGQPISPNALEAELRCWKRCPACEDRGKLGSPIDLDLRFCDCPAGTEVQCRDGNDCLEREMGRVHVDARSILIAACEELGQILSADLLRQAAAVVDDGTSITITPGATDPLSKIYAKDRGTQEDFQAVFRRLQWERVVVWDRGGQDTAKPPASPPASNGGGLRTITDADFEPLLARRVKAA